MERVRKEAYLKRPELIVASHHHQEPPSTQTSGDLAWSVLLPYGHCTAVGLTGTTLMIMMEASFPGAKRQPYSPVLSLSYSILEEVLTVNL